MELNKAQVLRVDELFDDFQTKMRDEGFEEDEFILVKKNKEPEDQGPKPFSQISFGVNGIELKSNQDVETTSKVMKDLLKNWGKEIPGYIR